MCRVVAFIDLLGFSHYVRTDPRGAADLLENMHAVLSTRMSDAAATASGRYSGTASSRLLTACDYFVPMSDSVFIIADDANLLMEQLSTFLMSCFQVTSHAFAYPEVVDDPTRVTERVIGMSGNGPVVVDEVRRWYPVLFRGGIASGSVKTGLMQAIASRNTIQVPNLLGSAVVEAVALESSGKGPRLFAGKSYIDSLDEAHRRYTHRSQTKDGNDCFEILWPAYKFNATNDPEIEVNEICEPLLAAVRLAAALEGKDVANHYQEFVKLLVRSGLRYAQEHGVLVLMWERIQSTIAGNGTELLLRIAEETKVEEKGRK